MEEVIFATGNAHKIEEVSKILSNTKILSLKDIGFTKDIKETGTTCMENALIKAETVYKFAKEKGFVIPVISEDSGLFVKALKGAPGVYSARYSGPGATDAKNRAKVLKLLENKKNRSAYFSATVVKLFPNGKFISAEGKTYGKILTEELGDKSFGYDCIFYSLELKKCFGEATKEEKNSVSHRFRAFKALKEEEEKLNN